MQQINIFLRFSRVSFSYKDSLSKVLMSDMLTTTTESIPTTNVHSCMRILYKGTHVANQNCSWGFTFLIPTQNVLMTGAPGYTTWVHLGTPGYTWVHLGTPGCTWVRLGTPGYTWVHLDAPGCTWVHLGTPGCTWVHLGAPGYTWVHLGAPGCTWVHLGTSGYTWVHLGTPGYT